MCQQKTFDENFYFWKTYNFLFFLQIQANVFWTFAKNRSIVLTKLHSTWTEESFDEDWFFHQCPQSSIHYVRRIIQGKFTFLEFFIFFKFLLEMSEGFNVILPESYRHGCWNWIPRVQHNFLRNTIFFWGKTRFGSKSLSRTWAKNFCTLSKIFSDLWHKLRLNCRNCNLRVQWNFFSKFNRPGRIQFFSLLRSDIEFFLNYC